MQDDRSVRRWLKSRKALPSETGTLDTAQLEAAMQRGAEKSAGERSATAPVAHDSCGVLIVADPHFGKLCWGRGTGGQDYDLDIAYETLTRGAAYLFASMPHVSRWVVASVGDVFQFDTLSGTTTSGTFVDRDSRVPKMLEVATEAMTTVVQTAASYAPTHFLATPGNHDEVLSASLQRIMVAHFRRDADITVDDSHTRSKAMLIGRNLVGFNHGDKRRKQLAANLAIEYPVLWGQSVYREIQTGHLHGEGERYEGTLTEAGVTVRTHRSLSPADQWHSDNGYIGAARGMAAIEYDLRGGLLGTRTYDPDLHRGSR